ncbi:hypothetical protein SK803_42375 [Lentzea sp. BCCO 10_0856]|uniref:Uncharacterized protein n=1 Tax=Lentzea miocenica TaxID=3095431 RepID=A0ABU4TFC9_9PSEU|nr:hypothetical protein [Lentzea sp. BCCO 10_0856]MDX8036883.1 hypothetical protein [Lentzea sp. BCCO 10_0856]
MRSVADFFAYAIWLFGFNYKRVREDDDPDLEEIVLSGFAVTPR